MKWSDWLGGVLVVAGVSVVGYFILSRTDRGEELKTLRTCSLDGCNVLHAASSGGGKFTLSKVLDAGCRSNKSILIDDDLIVRLQQDEVWKQQGCVK